MNLYENDILSEIDKIIESDKKIHNNVIWTLNPKTQKLQQFVRVSSFYPGQKAMVLDVLEKLKSLENKWIVKYFGHLDKNEDNVCFNLYVAPEIRDFVHNVLLIVEFGPLVFDRR